MKYESLAVACVTGSSNAVTIIDQMCKTAEVEYCMAFTKYGGRSTVVMTGSTAATQAAVDGLLANPPCKVIKAVVITRPSDEVVRILEEEMEKNQPLKKHES